jgi:alpha-D-ribose 1-methylphosphonate 5-triphosphate synthase subunit PhnH
MLAATPVPDAHELRTNATFEALMWALSRPGTVQDLPMPGMAGIAEALIDRECRVFCEDPTLAAQVHSLGAAKVPLTLADHAFLSGLEPARLAEVAVGSDLYPDDGATVVAPARLGLGLGLGQRLRLTGPGIETFADVLIDAVDARVWALRAARCRYPAGFDLFLIDGAKIMGLPRSTQVEVL